MNCNRDSKLFLVYLGGRTSKSNIELHDVRFVACSKIEESYGILREAWFGDVKGLHIDSYMSVNFIDGFRIELKKKAFKGPENLYFVNMGGYDPQCIAELHEFGLFVATSSEEAKKKAKLKLLSKSVKQHKDDMFDVDDCFVVNEVQEYFVHLYPDNRTQKFEPDWIGYNVIGDS